MHLMNRNSTRYEPLLERLHLKLNLIQNNMQKVYKVVNQDEILINMTPGYISNILRLSQMVNGLKRSKNSQHIRNFLS